MSSNREKRKIAREGAQKLKGTDWDPSGFVAKSPIERLQELAAQEAGQAAYSENMECAECVAERQKTGDETALCQKHLAEAMGF